MKIFINLLVRYVFYAFPITLAGYIFFIATGSKIPPTYGVFLRILWIGLAIHALIWTLISLSLSISMFFSQTNRDIILLRLSGLKEKDERETQITGKALKSSYLTTMTILLFLLFISLFSVHVSKKSAHNVEPGQKSGLLSLGIKFQFLDSEAAIVTQKEGYDLYFELNNIPISPTTLILILLLWQIVSYRFVAWRLSKIPDCPNSG